MYPRLLAALGIALFAAALPAHSQTWPSKGLRIVVPFAPGGSTDIFARLVGDRLATALGQPVVIDNRPGAGGNIGADAVAKSPPDGYTLLMATTGVMAINDSMYKNLSYDPAKDLKPVIYIASITNVLVVPTDSPFKSVADVVAAAKAAPAKVSFASSGSGSSTHMSAELFRLMTGTELLHIPYKGSGQAMPDVISGRVSMMFENMPGAVGHIKGGKLRVLAVTGTQRTPALPDVKTVAESGVPGYESLSWSGIAAPAGTPPEVVARLNREINTILATPEMKQKLAEQGAEAVGGTPEAFAEHIARERAKWSKVVREANIVVN
ncbi:Bug family tripartite tricarboxylate transporter substrate binding protein [Ramlibacter albus]|uniref:Tripartite tricarboxylate transporter substrate binding protein n=1 Tax=Ramlibacter albus TaxID=2079448 RepID=A0A923S5E0_9BURK|nr:tripartite tricarboxylate transporter substrate binding protein [Ramlibacter albus]MBC5768470.1 tripartite tricarboxylate transporter substrate binding protein [Ramlibacter albus]